VSEASTLPYDYATSIKVNVLELRQSVTASQLTKQLVIQNIKTHKNYSECIGNHEYSTALVPNKGLFFEIYPEDNSPFSKNYFKSRDSINQLIDTQGRVSLNCKNKADLSKKSW